MEDIEMAKKAKKNQKKRRPQVRRKVARRPSALQKTFLLALSSYPSVLKACETAEVSRATAYRWRDEDEKFAAEWDAAKDRGYDAVEDEAVRRAYEGTLKPVFQGGIEVGQIREYSDQLMNTILRGHRARYRDKSTLEVTGKNGKPMEHEHKHKLTNEQFRALPVAEQHRIMREETAALQGD